MFAAYSLLYARMFPQTEATILCSKQVVWEGKELGAIYPCATLLMKQEKYTFVCLAAWLLHRAVKLRMGVGGQEEWGR